MSVSTSFKKDVFYLKNPHLYEYHITAYYRSVPDEPLGLDNVGVTIFVWGGPNKINQVVVDMSDEWKKNLSEAGGEVVPKLVHVADLTGFNANLNFSIATQDPSDNEKRNCVFEAHSIRRVLKQ
jgi:hypothetical protein